MRNMIKTIIVAAALCILHVNTDIEASGGWNGYIHPPAPILPYAPWQAYN